jgi:GNAT superfamily N-acetyltransferase
MNPEPTDQAIHLRRATPDDAAAMFGMMKMLAEELGSLSVLHATAEDWARDGFGKDPKFTAWVAIVAGDPVGMITYSPLYMPDVGKTTYYVHQLYVKPPFRRRKLGKALLAKVAATAIAEDVPLVDLGTIEDPKRHRFFREVGFDVAAGYVTYLVFGETLVNLAASALDSLF